MKRQPRKARTAPEAFKNSAYQRSEAALQKIEEGKARIERDLDNKSLLASLLGLERVELTQRAFLESCGLHYNFLNGEKHKEQTKQDVKDFLLEVNHQLRRQLAEAPDVNGAEAPSLELAQLRARYDRLRQDYDRLQNYLDRVLTRINQWHLDLRQAHRIIRELKASAGLSVVHLRRREPH